MRHNDGQVDICLMLQLSLPLAAVRVKEQASHGAVCEQNVADWIRHGPSYLTPFLPPSGALGVHSSYHFTTLCLK